MYDKVVILSHHTSSLSGTTGYCVTLSRETFPSIG